MKLALISLAFVAVKATADDTFSSLRGVDGTRDRRLSHNADEPIVLGACEDFAVMAGSTATCAGSLDCDIIGGYLGVYPGTSVSGNFAGDTASTADTAPCADDGLAAWSAGRAMTSGETMLAEMEGVTFTPGVYTHASAINIAAAANPEVTLDAGGDPSAVFIFNAGNTLTTSANSRIVLKNGARQENVFWVLGTALTMGADSILVGNVLAGSAITVGTNGIIMGRAIAQTAVTCETHCTIETNGRHSASPSSGPTSTPTSSPTSLPTVSAPQTIVNIVLDGEVTLEGLSAEDVPVDGELADEFQNAITIPIQMLLSEFTDSTEVVLTTSRARRLRTLQKDPKLKATFRGRFSKKCYNSRDCDSKAINTILTKQKDKLATAVNDGSLTNSIQKEAVKRGVPQLREVKTVTNSYRVVSSSVKIEKTNPFMESMVVPGVADKWTTVSLSETYVSPVAVCTVVYAGSNLLPAVVRMQNVGPQSFQIRLQNPRGDALQALDVHCVVVEEGSWEMPDGRKIEANKYVSTITDWKNNYNGEAQPCANACSTTFIVLGQVMSYNDPQWSVFWSRGQDQQTPPNGSNLFTGKHVGEDTSRSRVDEVVGYIVIEEGHAVSGKIEIETARGLDIVIGYVQTTKVYNFQKAFSTTPTVAVLSQVAMDGGDGSWAVSASKFSVDSMSVAVDEDRIGDADRGHTGEQVDYIVFSTAGTVTLSKPDSNSF